VERVCVCYLLVHPTTLLTVQNYILRC
jgi:hypothetical protein